MPHIVLTEEQARILAEAGGPIDVRDAQGNPVASLTLLSAEDLEEIERLRRKRASGVQERSIPSEQVQAFMRKLQEIDEREGIDQAKVDDLLRRVRAGETL